MENKAKKETIRVHNAFNKEANKVFAQRLKTLNKVNPVRPMKS